ncbi:MAG: hypothetical protein HUK01_01295 [Bacteroidaceae bacterium]|nr:hypothetical protein [Bacteroidaceae bacterium]
MRSLNLFVLGLMVACLFMACDNEKVVTHMPTFRGFSVVNGSAGHSQPQHGDILTITAVQKTQGNRINTTVYSWKLTDSNNKELYSISKSLVYGVDASDPKVLYQVPDSVVGTVTVTFEAEYHFSADLDGFSPAISNDPEYVGSIRTSASSLLGRASGTCTFNVLPKY